MPLNSLWLSLGLRWRTGDSLFNYIVENHPSSFLCFCPWSINAVDEGEGYLSHLSVCLSICPILPNSIESFIRRKGTFQNRDPLGPKALNSGQSWWPDWQLWFIFHLRDNETKYNKLGEVPKWEGPYTTMRVYINKYMLIFSICQVPMAKRKSIQIALNH